MRNPGHAIFIPVALLALLVPAGASGQQWQPNRLTATSEAAARLFAAPVDPDAPPQRVELPSASLRRHVRTGALLGAGAGLATALAIRAACGTICDGRQALMFALYTGGGALAGGVAGGAVYLARASTGE